MRILHLAPFLQGGAGRVIVDLATDQSRAGHDVSVIASRTPAPGYGNYDGYLDELRTNRIPVHLIDSMFVREHAANLAVVRLLDSHCGPGEEPDVIHTHAAISSMVALLFAGARRTPMTVVQTMHGWGLSKTGDQVETDVTLLNLVDGVVVPSRQSAATITSLGVVAERVIVVPYGISDAIPPLDAPAREARDAMLRARARGALAIVCVGTVGRRKNQRLLLDALALVKDRMKTFCLFVGDGDVEGLRAAAETSGIGEDIWVHGYSRAARALAGYADVLVLPSSSEGQPIAVLEAFCDRTLVAVSDIPELAELVDDGVTGVRFASGDARSLADALGRVVRLPASARREMRDRALAIYASRFSMATMTAAYQQLYDTLRRAPSASHGPALVAPGKETTWTH